jgi:transposase-like protein
MAKTHCSNVHVCTTESLQAGIDIPAGGCPFCGNKTLQVGWVSSDCSLCRASFCDHSGYTVRSVREGMKMTRKQLAEAAGLKTSTIKRYEWVWPSRKYWDWLKGYTKVFFEEEGEL